MNFSSFQPWFIARAIGSLGRLSGSAALGLLLAACLLAGCAREHSVTKSPNASTVSFSQAGISLVLGTEWEASNLNSKHSLQPPTLVSQAGTIRVILLPPDRSEPEIVADGLRASFEANPVAAKHSFRRQRFTTDSGASGVCVSYTEQQEKQGELAEIQNRHYLLKNRANRCVAIQYQVAANAAADSENVARTIRSTLAVR
jgi:hypothetical protein